MHNLWHALYFETLRYSVTEREPDISKAPTMEIPKYTLKFNACTMTEISWSLTIRVNILRPSDAYLSQ